MVSLDEPDHARLRKPAARAFSMRRVTAMIGTIEATTKRLLDQVAAAPEFDLVAALAFPLPANIVFSLMGVPERDFAQLKYWCGYRAALSWGRPAPEIRSRSPVRPAPGRRRPASGVRPGPHRLNHRPRAAWRPRTGRKILR